MKTAELFEAKVTPDWARQEELELRALLKRFGLTVRRKPAIYKERWTFGGPLIDIDKKDISLPLEKRVTGLRRAVAQRLFDAKEAGREVVVYQPHRYGYISSQGSVFYGVTDFLPKHLYHDDSLAQIETMLRDRLYINNHSGGGYDITFQYGLSEPKIKEEPKSTERKFYRVKGAK